MTFLHLGSQMVNLDCVARIEYEPPYNGGEWLEDEQAYSKSRPAILELTLTTVDLATYSEGFNEVKTYVASKSQVITVRGLEAEHVWDFLELRAINAGERLMELKHI